MSEYQRDAPNLLALCLVMGVASIAAVALRFVARIRSKSKLSWDDLFSVIALVAFVPFLGLIIFMGYNGEGYPLTELPLPVLANNLRGAYARSILSPTPVAAGRTSVMFLYFRVFSIDQTFRRNIYILAVLNAAWWIGCTVALICYCIPTQALWNPLVTGRCIDGITFQIAAAIPDSLLDFALIALAINVLRKLQTPLRYKINLGFIFAVGGFVGVIGFLRIAITYRPANFTYIDNTLWLTIQLGFAVICPCLPTYMPLLPKKPFWVHVRSLTYGLVSILRSSPPESTHSAPTEYPQASTSKPGEASQDSTSGKDSNRSFTHVARNDPEAQMPEIPLQTIHVEQSFDVATSSSAPARDTRDG